MNEFEYEVRQKKAVASGARHRVNGSKSRRCTLPSDYLTAAQKRQLNGKVYCMNLNEPLTWEELIELPLNMAKEYIEHLHTVHMAPIKGAAKMFGVDKQLYVRYLATIGATFQKSAGRRPAEVEAVWRAFWQPESEPTPEETPVVEQIEEERKALAPEAMTMTISGTLDQLAAYIKLLPMDGQLRMTVAVKRI